MASAEATPQTSPNAHLLVEDVQIGIPWLDTIADRINPILVKEVRQSLKGRGFVGAFFLLLASSWLISIFGVVMGGEEIQYGSSGRGFFFMYYIVLAAALFFVVPMSAFRMIQSERDLNTFEMLTITTLTPLRVVWGKWLCSCVLMFLFTAGIAPFMVLTTLLRGISVGTIFFLIFWSILGSMLQAMIAVSISTISKNRQVTGGLGALQGLSSLYLFGASMGGTTAMLMTELPVDQPWFWVSNVVTLLFYIPIFIFFRQLATANLMFEGANRSTGLRVTSSIIILLPQLIVWTLEALGSYFPSWGIKPNFRAADLIAFSVMSMIGLAVIALFAVTEDERFSRRVRRELPKPGLYRLLTLPFQPGCGRGLLWLWGIMLVIAGSTMSFALLHGLIGTDMDDLTWMLVGLISYMSFYLGITSWLTRTLRKLGPEITPNHGRVLGVIIFALGIIMPHMTRLIDFEFINQFPLIAITDPMGTHLTYYVLTVHNYSYMPAVILLGVVGVLLNVPLLLRSIQEMLTAQAPVYAPLYAPSAEARTEPAPS